jgi:hypothetical protein
MVPHLNLPFVLELPVAKHTEGDSGLDTKNDYRHRDHFQRAV